MIPTTDEPKSGVGGTGERLEVEISVAADGDERPPVDDETGSGGGYDSLEQRLERRSDLNNGGDIPESRTASGESGSTTDEMSRKSSQNRGADRRSCGVGLTDSESDGRDVEGHSAREQRLNDADEDENWAAEATELPAAYRHELPNLRD